MTTEILAPTTEDSARGQAVTVTWEAVLWAAVIGLAAILRLTQLGSVPLAPDEAANALAAWDVYESHAAAMPQGPLFTYGTAFVFFVFGASDTTARMLPALSGIALAALPMVLRRRFGRVSALICAFLLATSPTLVLYSRRVDSVALVAFVSLAIVVGVVKLLETMSVKWSYALALGFGALLVGGPLAYSALVSLGCLWLTLALRQRLGTGHRGSWVRDERFGPLAADARRYALVAAVGGLFIATGLLSNLHGIQDGVIDSLDMWVKALIGVGSLNNVADTLWSLMVYEPIVFVLGVAGAIVSWLGDRRLGKGLSIWLLSALVLTSLAGTVMGGVPVLVLVPLIVLGSTLAGPLALRLFDPRARRDTVYFALVAVPLLWLTAFALGFVSNPEVDLPAQVPTSIAVVPLACLAVALVLYVWRMGPVRAWGAAGIVGLLVLGLFAVHTTSLLQRDGFELLSGPATSPDVRALVSDVRDGRYALRANGSEGRIRVETSLRLPLAWYLRDLNAAFGDAADSRDSLVVAAPGSPAPAWPCAAQRYIFLTLGPQSPGSTGEWWRWFYYRDPIGEMRVSNVVLYVRTQEIMAWQ